MVCIDDEIPFKIPKGWEWCRLESVFELRSGQDFPPEKYNDKSLGIPYITGASNIDGNVIIQNRWTEFPSVIAPKGCLLLVCKGSGVGKMCYMILPQAHIARQIQAIIPFTSYILIDFLRLTIECRLNEITSQANGVIPGIAREATLSFLLPIPPFKEQIRIIKIVKEIEPLVLKYEICEQKLGHINTAILSLLQKSILQEAIQGKLVPQDASEEPASVLLQHIKEEKLKLVKEGKLKKKEVVDSFIYKGDDNKYYEQIGQENVDVSDEIPFDLPESWQWTRLGQIVRMSIGKTPARGDSSNWTKATKPWVSISDMADYSHIKTTKEKISDVAASTLMGAISPCGSLLMSFKLTVGRTSILDIEAYHNEAIISIYPYIDEEYSLRDFLFYSLPILANMGDSKDAIKGKTLNSKSLNNLLIPLPPLKEQRHIIKRLEELYARL